MLSSMNDDLKKIFLAGVGAIAVTSEKSKQMVDELVKKGELTLEQGKTLNEELKRNMKEKIRERVGTAPVDVQEIKDAIGSMSRQDLAEIRAKIAEIDAAAAETAPQDDDVE